MVNLDWKVELVNRRTEGNWLALPDGRWLLGLSRWKSTGHYRAQEFPHGKKLTAVKSTFDQCV